MSECNLTYFSIFPEDVDTRWITKENSSRGVETRTTARILATRRVRTDVNNVFIRRVTCHSNKYKYCLVGVAGRQKIMMRQSYYAGRRNVYKCFKNDTEVKLKVYGAKGLLHITGKK